MLEQLEQQKRLTANQWKLIATTNLADLLDFFDLLLIGYVLAFITKEWQLTYWQGAMILLSSGLGAVPGAFLWGWVADRIGRRKVFIATALNIALDASIFGHRRGHRITPGPAGLSEVLQFARRPAGPVCSRLSAGGNEIRTIGPA